MPETPAPYPGIDGFLPTRASIMLDVVFVAMALVIPLMLYAIYLVKYRRAYALHKKIQLTLAAVLLLAVAAFEIDMQFISGWRERAIPSPYYATWVFWSLYIHLAFAVSTLLLWVLVIWQAVKRFPNPPAPNEHSARHMLTGKLAAIGMTMTAITGWIFYCFAFVLK